MLKTNKKVTKWEMFGAVTRRGIAYNFVEFGLILVFGIMLALRGIWVPLLWVAAMAAAVWTILASMSDAQDEARDLLLEGEVFITDFAVGALFLVILSMMTLSYGVQFATLFLLAAIQNLRYTALCYDWLIEEKNGVKNSEGNNLP